MTSTISAGNGTGTTTPLTVLSPYSASWASRNVIHALIGGGIAVSLVTPDPRRGVLELLYGTAAEAYQAIALHREETAFTLIEDDPSHISMTYVVDGELSVRLDPETLILWIASIGFQEVVP
ncbi:MAG TPA: hypothetical protein VNN23_08190 [Ornithinibacter sp.]|nr:hypothetical protein [Ornithinibacter sp.]